MVIFRIIFNLFRMASRLVFNIFWLPVFILMRSPMLVVIAILGIAIIAYFSSDDTTASRQTNNARNANPPSMIQGADGKQMQVASPVRVVEDGDSTFANDLYAQMTEEERAYYSQTYFWIMNNVADGQTHSWSHIDIAGSMKLGTSFTNKAGARCRPFAEALKVHSVQQNLTGIACQRDAASWCKLNATATPACGLGHTPSFFESIGSGLGKLF